MEEVFRLVFACGNGYHADIGGVGRISQLGLNKSFLRVGFKLLRLGAYTAVEKPSDCFLPVFGGSE